MTTKDEALQMALEALTCIDDDIDDPGHRCGCCDDYVDRNGHVRAAIREALAQKDEQEPVAWVDVKDTHQGPYDFHGIDYMPEGKHLLYTAPPKPTIDKRVKVKLGGQYGFFLEGNWFYLQPADEFANAALYKHTGVDHDAP